MMVLTWLITIFLTAVSYHGNNTEDDDNQIMIMILLKPIMMILIMSIVMPLYIIIHIQALKNISNQDIFRIVNKQSNKRNLNDNVKIERDKNHCLCTIALLLFYVGK